MSAFSSPFPLSISNQRNQCATCSKKLGWLNIFSKQVDKDGNQFCESKCFNKFYDLYCDKCNERKIGNPSYFINEEEKEGIMCFNCVSTECLKCHKTIPHSPEYLASYFQRAEKEKDKNFSEKNYFPLCKSCQLSRNSYTRE